MKIFSQVVWGLLVISNFVEADFRDDALAQHNKYRRKHHVPDFVRNSTLNKFAQARIEALMKDGKSHDFNGRNGNYGENLCMSYTPVTDSGMVNATIDMWYNGIKMYDYNKPEGPKDANTRAALQIIWKNTKTIGIGVARSSSATYVCVDYDPPGNYREAYAENVLKP